MTTEPITFADSYEACIAFAGTEQSRFMSALAEHPNTASISASATVVLGETDVADLLIEESIEFDVLGPALLNVQEEPEDDYPAGAGPYGF